MDQISSELLQAVFRQHLCVNLRDGICIVQPTKQRAGIPIQESVDCLVGRRSLVAHNLRFLAVGPILE
ncbi:MAG: hypothetical protein A4E58_01570 [Syntrophorhabdus sp. PtaB.Bin006]|nr:MAG: hypothetical protein A4E58_01570 [Syntrophorhabdus sp. PtaB.Bin006]